MKGFCLVVLLCAFVQVQCLNTYVFSSQSHYGLFSSSTSPIQDSTVIIQFDQEVIEKDCAVTSDSCVVITTNDTSITVTTGVVTYDTAKKTASFSPQVVSPATFSGVVEITFTVPGGTFKSPTGASFSESSPYTVHVGGLLIQSAPVWNVDAESSRVSVEFSFNRKTYSVADGHDAEQPFVISNQKQSGSSTTQVRNLGYSHIGLGWSYSSTAEHGDLACLKAASSGPVLRDIYGNVVNSADVAQSCKTVEFFCGPFTEWSECLYTCQPEVHDMQFNKQTRQPTNKNDGICDQPAEERQCQTNQDFKCYIQIQGGETGNECAAENLGCNTDSIDPVFAPSGCKCSPDCLGTKDCCQSYYPSCVADFESEKYFYEYSSCWQVNKCGTDGTLCTQGFVNKGGDCPIENSVPSQSREFKYSCFCSIASFQCYDFSDTDMCCGGGDNYKATCEA